jgi:hypothetical protein
MALDYAEVEAVLAQLHHAGGAVQHGAFRGRLAHLRRLGIPIGLNPGKGKRISYEIEQLYQLALCLELAEFGLDPSLIVKMVKQFWATQFYLLFTQAEMDLDFCLGPEHIPSDIGFAIQPEFMAGNWHRREGAFAETFPGLIDFGPFRTAEDAGQILAHRRSCILNLSVLIRLIRQAMMDLGMSDRLPAHLQPGVPEAKAYERSLVNGARVSDGS